MRHNPRKRFGQNFLIDQHIVSQIIATIHPQQNDRIIEIGPGLGALTRPLLQAVDHLDVVEIDRDIVARLRKEFSQEKLTIHTTDALKFDFSALGNNLRIIGNLPYNISTPLLFHLSQFSEYIGNLPYNISTPLLFHLSQFSEYIADMYFMLQKEVVDRMVSMSAKSDYGRLSVMLQYRFDMEHVFSVPAESFSPAPKVESAIVQMIPRLKSSMHAQNEALLSQVVSAAFSQRRKTLRNTLRNVLNTDDFCALGIDPGLRAENLSVEHFVAIANFLGKRVENRVK